LYNIIRRYATGLVRVAERVIIITNISVNAFARVHISPHLETRGMAA